MPAQARQRRTALRIGRSPRAFERRVALHVRDRAGSTRSTLARSYPLPHHEPAVGVLELSLGTLAFTFGLAMAVVVNPMLPF